MAEERLPQPPREFEWRQLFPFVELFRGFQVALDLNKLLLAAAGIAVMAFFWWFLAFMFTLDARRVPPEWPGSFAQQEDGWRRFREARAHWNLMNETAGLDPSAKYEVLDLAESPEEYDELKDFRVASRLLTYVDK